MVGHGAAKPRSCRTGRSPGRVSVASVKAEGRGKAEADYSLITSGGANVRMV